MSAARHLTAHWPSNLMAAIEGLPKESAVRLKWCVAASDAALSRLMTANDPRGALREATVEFFRNATPIVSEVFPLLLGPDANDFLQAGVETAASVIERDLGDPAAASALRWASVHAGAMASMAHGVTAAQFEGVARDLIAELEELVDAPMGGLLRSQVLVLAVLNATESTPVHPHTVELAWLAFEEATTGVDACGPAMFGKVGRRDDGEAVLDAARWARESLTESDLRVLDGARVRRLR